MVLELPQETNTEQTRLFGEKATIRVGDQQNFHDVQNVLEILNSKQYLNRFSVQKGRIFTEKDAQEELAGNPFEDLDKVLLGTDFLAEKTKARFFVSRSIVHNDNEHGEIQGKISIYRDVNYDSLHKKLEVERVAKEITTLKESKCPRLQISWAKRPSAKAGQMASGVRQVLYEVYKRMSVLQESASSISVPAVVIAYIESDNEESMRVAESSGFVQLYDDLSGQGVWQVDWELFMKKLKTPELPNTVNF